MSGAAPSELARTHKVARKWLYKLLARFKEGGYPALEPRSRRRHSCLQRAPAIAVEGANLDVAELVYDVMRQVSSMS
ncbi:MAG: hypothetical protein ACREPI_11905 [Candidatus Dormibacterales bacterium]